MHKRYFNPPFLSPILILAGIILLPGCEQNNTPSTGLTVSPIPAAANEKRPVAKVPAQSQVATETTQTQFNIGNKSYLFDISNHSLEELEALLKRAEEIGRLQPSNYDGLKIVMILHGPDIDWFTQNNYEHNRQLVDLAAELDALEIIDMKVCETTMSGRGVNREDIPLFIESVPYAPDEMQRLLHEGYINL